MYTEIKTKHRHNINIYNIIMHTIVLRTRIYLFYVTFSILEYYYFKIIRSYQTKNVIKKQLTRVILNISR